MRASSVRAASRSCPEADKERALRVLMAQYRAPDFPYAKAVIPATTVLCLTVEHMTGKRRAKKHG